MSHSIKWLSKTDKGKNAFVSFCLINIEIDVLRCCDFIFRIYVYFMQEFINIARIGIKKRYNWQTF